MPLTRIELSDFKSYRGHHVIGPFTPFTSIIGPNGAGKSNLMDAISFVLGVKSAQLRSSQLKDLVYRGRRLGRPDGDASQAIEDEEEDEEDGDGDAKKAWVLAVYEDQDKKQWRYRRTITTTGSSEYKLNDQVVSAQAYSTSLAKHNILTKAKNFLVFQGDVEHIASQSPKDLTRLVEQISGSLELAADYERAKQAVDRAAENATESFNKKRGIAGEIKVFKEQMTEAERFEDLVGKRDDLILKRFLWKLFHIEEQIASNSREIIQKNKTLAGLRREQAAHNKALEDARAKQAKVRSDVSAAEKKVKKAEKALEGKKPDLVAAEGRILHAQRKLKNHESTREAAAKDAKKKEDLLAVLRKDLAAEQKAADAARDAARRASQKNLSLSEENLEEYRRLRAQANTLAVDERQSLQALIRDEKTSARALASLQEAYTGLEETKSKLETEIADMEDKKEEVDRRVASLQTDYSRAKQELNKQQAEFARISQLETELNEKLAECHEKLLQAGVDRKESERDARLKETLSNLQRIFPGVRGRVVDLCKPTQRKYETAVSVILGRNIDAVVVDQEKTAIECIEYMRNQRAGQATFIPLDTIQVKPINDKYRSFARGARLAADVIQYEPAVERAMHYACGNALVCDTMDVARYVCYEKGQEVKAVTLEGTVIHKSGLITGGRSSHGDNKKWEDKDIQGLTRVRDSLLSQLRDLNKSRPRSKADEGLVAEITRLESSLTLAKDDLAALTASLKGKQDELKHIKTEMKRKSPELKQAKASHAALTEKMEALASVVNGAEDSVFTRFCAQIGVENIREYESRQLKVANEEAAARRHFETQIARLTHQSQFEEQQLATLRERLEALEAAINSEHTAIATHEAEKQAVQEEIDQLQESITEFQEELKELNDLLDSRTKELEAVKKNTSKAAKVLDQALKEIATKNDEIEKLASERSSIYRKCRLEEIKLPLRSGNLRNVPIEENLREEVTMDIDEDDEGTQKPRRVPDYGIEVEFDLLDDEEREDASAEMGSTYDSSITKLNSEIERMAPNMKAMDKLDNVQTKLEETEKEAEKARKESKKARDDFNDIRKRRCDLFNKAFTHISERIDRIYKDLTMGPAAPLGGVAYLSLEDNEEPFAGGVKYHAMPPMKRFRDMDQLSGGEKTVAALALLFAVHSYQPAPFFVLDEVDAALDNTNVGKIATYIRSRASNSFQFVVISLKASLYERGNSLVGIYRDQDVNSSSALTLDLTQYGGDSNH
ncbi:cohesin complex subunit psm1 [Fomitiporia mediterranea MF3/22]|uniref:cohesin complex subunit psm1 n=1 Tax=Fomitiporia mediterranea (strain MF3/22) TaxID=694068 RepID=UPI0004407A4E|nr:cohesin complex subunit psm1 [Fomitiporia mediterranea MF3/22]EJC99202.1 cohesin complex subunit psm1 [Fomitiporia mediterranea MF3/22]